MPKGRACCPLPWNFKAFSSAFGRDMAADPSTRTSPLVSCLRRDFQVTWGLCGCGFMNLLWGTVPPAYAERRTRSPPGKSPSGCNVGHRPPWQRHSFAESWPGMTLLFLGHRLAFYLIEKLTVPPEQSLLCGG